MTMPSTAEATGVAPRRSATAAASRTPGGAPRRRNVPWIVVGVLIVVGSGLAFAVWGDTGTERTAALALARDVDAGEAIGRDDLRSVRIGSDEPLMTVPPEATERVLGRVAAADLAAGTFVVDSLLVERSALAPGSSLVGLPLEPADLPLPDLSRGDSLLLVEVRPPDASAASGDPTAGLPPAVWPAEVFLAREVDDGTGLRAPVVPRRAAPRSAAAGALAAADGRIRPVVVGAVADLPLEVLAGGPASTDPAPAPEPDGSGGSPG